MALLQHGHEVASGISCNDRKFEVWTLKNFFEKDGKKFSQEVKVQVYAVPKNGFRGNEADGFKIVINGVPVVSRDLADLRRKAETALRDLDESNHEKVLFVKTSGGFQRLNEDAFGLEWRIGWRIAKLGIVLDETRSYPIDVENYDEDYQPEIAGEIMIGSKPGHRGVQLNKNAVIPWTAEREEVLRKAITAIGKMRDDLNAALLKPEAFTSLLDARAGVLLLGGTTP
jgi:hypothetical protein